MDVHAAASEAKSLVAAEVERQNAMWGDLNERADVAHGQLLFAAMAQGQLVLCRAHGGLSDEDALAEAKVLFYPDDWSGFRDYGSEIANLAVMAAYIENEIKRRLLKGESTYRAPRRPDQAYDPATGLPKQQA
jgi:hypothetical protein